MLSPSERWQRPTIPAHNTPVRLKKTYSSREVAALTGLTARQLQWWDAHGIFASTIGTRPTAAGGFTERRYSPVEVLELLVLANLRRRGFTVQNIRLLLDTLRTRFGIRLYDAIEGRALRLFTDNRDVIARTDAGQLLQPDQVRRPADADAGRGGAEGAARAAPSRREEERRRAATVRPVTVDRPRHGP